MISLALLTLFQSQPTIESLNDFLKKRDIKSLSALSTGDGSEFKVLKGGAYSVGQYGWKALPLEPKSGKKFVVFTTPLTSEDIGELVFERVGTKLKYISETFFDGLRLRHHDLTAKFDIPKREVLLTDTVSGTVSPIVGFGGHLLRFSPCYKVSSLTADGKAVDFVQSGGVVFVPVQPTGNLKFDLSYRGKVDLPQYAGAINSTSATLTNDYWYPLVNRMPTTYNIAVFPPSKDWKVVAQGKFLGVVEGAHRYQMDMPAIYWSLTTAKLQQTTEKIDGRTFHTWSETMSLEQMTMQNQLFAPILKHFSKNFSEYPFESWGGLDSVTYGGGALEAYSFATYGGQWLPDEDPHEPSHTWWGGIIPNTYLKSFWNESFAVWSEGFYQREVIIGNTMDRREAFSTVSMPSPQYNAAPLVASGVDIGTAAGELGYGKGAYVLSMLEQLVSTQSLVESVQEWIRIHPKGEPGEWEGFEAVVLRRHPHLSLQSFFDDWFRRPGFANVSVANATYSGGTFRATLKWIGPEFRMPLELWFENAVGVRQRMVFDTAKVSRGGSFEIRMPDFRPTKVYLDPYHKALRVGAEPQFQSFASGVAGMEVYRDPKQPAACKAFPTTLAKLPESLAGVLLIGHPDTEPRMKSLCAKAGFSVLGNNLTYKGTTIDLSKAAAFALLDSGDGKQCAIGLGRCIRPPNLGHARAGLVEPFGRFLRGETKFPARVEEAITVSLIKNG